MTVRVVIADDQHLVRAGFRMILSAESAIEVVGEASDGRDAVERTMTLQPDIVLMDIRMPGMDGLEATRQILADGENRTRVLILTTFDLDEYVFEALQAGASGFLLKDVPAEQLAAAIVMVHNGNALLSPRITRRLIEEFTTARSTTAHAQAVTDLLSPRELEVFRLLSCGLSNQEIASQLFVGETTVKTHVTRILSKLNLRDRVQAVVLAYECGIVAPRRTR